MITETPPKSKKPAKPRLIGYMRVSRSRQNTARQEDAMAAAKISQVFSDKISGRKWKRAGLDAALSLIRPGDKLAVEAIDRLGRTALEILQIIEELKNNGASLISLSEHCDSAIRGDRVQILFLSMLAEIEHTTITRRTQDGVTSAMARGQPRGGNSRHGTRVVMKGLKQAWGKDEFELLAQELWMIQPPLSDSYSRVAVQQDDPNAFKVRIVGGDEDHIAAFDQQMEAAVENWIAIIEGKITSGEASQASVTVRFRDGKIYSETFPTKGLICEASWHIRVFNLAGRQPNNIPVSTARIYFEQFGGVQVYDAGFRLPYYGVKQDWLNIEFDHSHRRNKSALLPNELHVPRALNDLPTQGRLFGFVAINTGREAQRASPAATEAGKFLKIQVTRDRLVTNAAYDDLRDAVRWSLDYYATRKRLRESEAAEAKRPSEPSEAKLTRLQQVFTEIRSELSPESYEAVEKEIADYVEARSAESIAREAEQILLGPLASSGMAALALEHETKKEYQRAANLLRQLKRFSSDPIKVNEIADDLQNWLARMTDLRGIFAPLLDREDREEAAALKAEAVLRNISDSLQVLIPKTKIIFGHTDDVYLPSAAYAEWHALFQNIFLNAANAMLDEDDAEINIDVLATPNGGSIRVSDRGTGVDIKDATKLFEPFFRRSDISEERRQLGLGGTGLGLTIVRIIAENRRCRARFIGPVGDYSTTFELIWS